HRLVAVRLGHTDTADTTCLHVPDIGLVVAGDAVYNGIHPYLVESTRQTRLEWLAALHTIQSLKPPPVLSRHPVPEGNDAPTHIDATRRYIRDFIRLNEQTATGHDLYDRMLELYPDRLNPGSLWASAHSAKAELHGM